MMPPHEIDHSGFDLSDVLPQADEHYGGEYLDGRSVRYAGIDGLAQRAA
jgi:hypothetical protein